MTRHTCLGIKWHVPWSSEFVARKTAALGGVGEKGLPELPGRQTLERRGAGHILEIVEDHRGDTYHAVYAVRFADVVYVLHAFQKKSKQGIKTPQADVRLIAERLKRAQADYESRGTP